MTWNSKVIWSEGMFLQPQHFQQQDRYLEHLVEGRTRPLTRFAWGFTRLEIDLAALLGAPPAEKKGERSVKRE